MIPIRKRCICMAASQTASHLRDHAGGRGQSGRDTQSDILFWVTALALMHADQCRLAQHGRKVMKMGTDWHWNSREASRTTAWGKSAH